MTSIVILRKKIKQAELFVYRHDFILSLIIAIAIAGIGYLIGYENNKVVPVNLDPKAHYITHSILSYMINWDGPNYISIAKRGYLNSYQTNFFPLYPILIHYFNYIIHSYTLTSLGISLFSFVGAIFFYLKIVKEYFKISKINDA